MECSCCAEGTSTARATCLRRKSFRQSTCCLQEVLLMHEPQLSSRCLQDLAKKAGVPAFDFVKSEYRGSCIALPSAGFARMTASRIANPCCCAAAQLRQPCGSPLVCPLCLPLMYLQLTSRARKAWSSCPRQTRGGSRTPASSAWKSTTTSTSEGQAVVGHFSARRMQGKTTGDCGAGQMQLQAVQCVVRVGLLSGHHSSCFSPGTTRDTPFAAILA